MGRMARAVSRDMRGVCLKPLLLFDGTVRGHVGNPLDGLVVSWMARTGMVVRGGSRRILTGTARQPDGCILRRSAWRGWIGELRAGWLISGMAVGCRRKAVRFREPGDGVWQMSTIAIADMN